ncbi:hypothetical protein WJX82_001465 [Trebouxia sp. C0006]
MHLGHVRGIGFMKHQLRHNSRGAHILRQRRGILTSTASNTCLKAEKIRMETGSQDSLDGSRMRPSSAIFALGGLAGRSMLALFMPTKEDPGALVTPPKTSAAGIFTCEDNQGADYVLDVAPEPTKKRNEVVKAGNMTLEELQVEYVKLRKKKRAQDSKFQVLQELCSKLRLENDALRVEASHKGKLSATVFLLEMEASSVKQTVLGWASGVKKAASDQASIMKKVPDQAKDFENFQPVAVPVWATANSDDKKSSSVVYSYTEGSLFSSPWDGAAAAAELDASACDEVDYEFLWTKGPQYWYDDGDDWGIDDE